MPILRCISCGRRFRGVDAESVVAAFKAHSHGSPVAAPAPAAAGPSSQNLTPPTGPRPSQEQKASAARTLRTLARCVEGPGVFSESV